MTQIESLRDFMLDAGKVGTWMTVADIARLNKCSEEVSSANLRHLRKVAYGGFVVNKKLIAGEWHYMVLPPGTVEKGLFDAEPNGS